MDELPALVFARLFWNGYMSKQAGSGSAREQSFTALIQERLSENNFRVTRVINRHGPSCTMYIRDPVPLSKEHIKTFDHSNLFLSYKTSTRRAHRVSSDLSRSLFPAVKIIVNG